MLPKDRYCLPQTLCFKRVEILLNCFGGIFQALAMIARSLDNQSWGQIK
jgi:hypothetical protein